jgi:probable HAF family extracellular repeat protein
MTTHLPSATRRAFLALALAVAASFTAFAQHAGYQITVLPDLVGAVDSYATGLNNHGDVVGVADFDTHTVGYVYHAASGTLTTIGGFGGAETEALGINDSGLVVGYSQTIGGNRQAFIWQSGILTALPTVGGANGYGWAVNNAGLVVGTTQNTTPRDRATTWTAGLATDLGTLGGLFSSAHAVSSAGHVAGVSGNGVNPGERAFRTLGGGPLTDLGNLGGIFTHVWGVNSSGTVVGWGKDSSGDFLAFMSTPGDTLVSLGTLGGSDSDARGINDAGLIVGSSENAALESRAFLYADGQMFDLNTLVSPSFGYVLVSATGINAHGQIVGQAYLASNPGVGFTYLATPIPEPSAAAALLGATALCVVALRRPRRLAP